MRSPDGSRCGGDRSWFAQDEGGVPLTAAVSRIPDGDGARSCDRPGRFTFELTRATADGSDRARWPVELRLGTERALPGGAAPARAETGYGPGGEDAALPTGAPRDIEGGTGFNDARKLRAGVWRDTLVPAQTRWYRVPVGWNQQLRYDVEFANEPARPRSGGVPSSSVWTELYAPGRLPVAGGAEFTTRRPYRGEPVRVSHGTVPVSWRNRTEPGAAVRPVRRDGDYYVAVTLGAGADRIAAHAAVRVVLRVDVKGRRKQGPEHDAPRTPVPVQRRTGAAAARPPGAGRRAVCGTRGKDRSRRSRPRVAPRPCCWRRAGRGTRCGAVPGFGARRRRGVWNVVTGDNMRNRCDRSDGRGGSGHGPGPGTEPGHDPGTGPGHEPGHGRRRAARAAALTALLCLTAGVLGGQAAPRAWAAGTPRGWEPAADAQRITGAASSADAPEVASGLFTDRIRPGQEKYYARSTWTRRRTSM